jgi:hypothetical protein
LAATSTCEPPGVAGELGCESPWCGGPLPFGAFGFPEVGGEPAGPAFVAPVVVDWAE